MTEISTSLVLERPMAEFVVAGSRTEQLLAYPYERPEGSFWSDGTVVRELPQTFPEFQAAANALLEAQGLPGLGQRVPLVVYGANSNPAKFSEKMAKFPVAPEMAPQMQSVPMIAASIPSAAVVWHGKPGQSGSVFAELYRGPETESQEARCHVAFLTPQQLLAMHTTEGTTYHLAELPLLVAEDQQPLTATVYVAGESTVLLRDGRLVPVRRASEPHTDGALSAEEAVEYMLAHAGEAVGHAAPRSYIEASADLDLAQKKARQEVVRARLAELGLNRPFSFPLNPQELIGRADFNSLPTLSEHRQQPDAILVRLAEQVAAPLRPAQDTPKNPRKDPMTAIRLRAYEELARRLSR